MRVLIVDDSATDRKLLRYYLTRAGWETVEAENGREAIDRIRENTPDLIISDALMPEVDGFQLLREVKKMRLTPSVPFMSTVPPIWRIGTRNWPSPSAPMPL